MVGIHAEGASPTNARKPAGYSHPVGNFFRPGVRRKATGGQTPTSGRPSPARCPGLPPPRSPTARRRSATRRVSPSPVPRPRNGSGRRRGRAIPPATRDAMGFFERHTPPAAAMTHGSLPAGSVDEDSPHRLGGGGEEVAAAVEVLVADQPQVCLVDKRRWRRGCGRGLRRPSSRRRASAVRRRRAGSRSAAAWRSPFWAASRRRVTSDMTE